jgi:hypothetical protein
MSNGFIEYPSLPVDSLISLDVSKFESSIFYFGKLLIKAPAYSDSSLRGYL